MTPLSVIGILLLFAACGGGSERTYHLGDGDYTEAELRTTWRDLIDFMGNDFCPGIRARDDDEVVQYIRDLGEGEDDSFQAPDPDDVKDAVTILREECGD
jgi:hypothetical protein